MPGLTGYGTRVGDLPDRPYDALAVVAIALQCLPLAVRRRWPALCLAVVSIGFAVDQLRGYHTVAGTALPVALLSVGAHLGPARSTVAVLASVAYVPLAVALDRSGSAEGVSGFVLFYVMLVVIWGAGAWLRQTRIAEAERRRHVAEATRIAERTRIARELHDVVTYRVVREALTNALKYAHGQPTEVHVTHGEKEISVEVRTAGSRRSHEESVGGSGRGLRDRVQAVVYAYRRGLVT